jgi:aminoglycoside phosphotransferase (APT) family kinase protein
MGREYKILKALSKTYSKAPSPYLYTEEESIIGAPFYVMERVEGVILRSKMPKEMCPDPEMMRNIAGGLIDTFLELHNVDYQSVGLGNLGRPEGYVERQIKGWTKRYFKSKTDEIPSIEKVAEWLNDNMPPTSGAALIHNDFKYDNLVLDSEDWTKVVAVLDWEMSTIGDPLMDLGTSLGYWVTQNDPEWMQRLALSPTILPGNPSRSELVELYAQKSGRDVGNVVFYYVYGIFKVSVIIQQIYYRYKKGLTSDERFASLIDGVRGLGAMAVQAIEKGQIDDLFT